MAQMFVSKEQFRKKYSESIRSKISLNDFLKGYAISVVPSAFRTPDQEKVYQLNMPLGTIGFRILSTGTIASFSMNESLLDVAGDAGGKTLYRLCNEFHYEITSYSIDGLADAMYEAVYALYHSSGVKELILELEANTNKSHNAIYRVVAYEGKEEREIIKTARYSEAIDTMKRLEDTLPDYSMTFRGYSGRNIQPISGYEKATAVKRLFGKRDIAISPCSCGYDEPMTTFVVNNLKCSKCGKPAPSRAKSFDIDLALLGTIKRLVEEMSESKRLLKGESKCSIRFSRADWRYASIGVRAKRLLFRTVFRIHPTSAIILQIDSINGWTDREKFDSVRDLVHFLQQKIAEECAHSEAHGDIPDTSCMSASVLEQFLRIEFWTIGIEPTKIDIGRIDKGMVDISLHKQSNDVIETTELSIPFGRINNPNEMVSFAIASPKK